MQNKTDRDMVALRAMLTEALALADELDLVMPGIHIDEAIASLGDQARSGELDVSIAPPRS